MEENIKNLSDEEIAVLAESEVQNTFNSESIETLVEEGVIENVQNQNN